VAESAASLKALGQPLLWVSEKKLSAWLDRWEGPLAAAGVDLCFEAWPEAGECCEPMVQRLMDSCRRQNCRALAGCGGGKLMDSVKLAAARLGLAFACIPSSPATCACATRVAVLYDEDGCYREVLDLEQGPSLCILDSDLLSSAPARHRAAGLADTLAKHLEAEAAGAGAGLGISAGLDLARLAHGRCLAHGAAWLSSQDPADASSQLALEAVTLMSGMASCLGEVPAAAAHSLANGLSLLPACRALLHGELVGLGLLWQDAILMELGRPLPGGCQGPEERRALLRSWGLPLAIPAQGLEGAGLAAVVEKSLQEGESIHGIPGLERLGPRRLQSLLEAMTAP
jgi:glycerol dehydrogenase-like iron-containing ADH family enzyme